MENRKFEAKDCPEGFTYDDLPSPWAPIDPWMFNFIVYSPDKSKFAFIYDIVEATMLNYTGLLIYGEVHEGVHKLADVNEDFYIRMDANPQFESIHWVNNSIFLFRSQLYDGETKQLFMPACGVDFGNDLFVVPNTNYSPAPLTDIKLEKISFLKNPNGQKMLDYFHIMQKQGDMPVYVHLA